MRNLFEEIVFTKSDIFWFKYFKDLVVSLTTVQLHLVNIFQSKNISFIQIPYCLRRVKSGWIFDAAAAPSRRYLEMGHPKRY
jgi:hypothetical protein